MAIFNFTGTNGAALPTGLTASNGTFEINSNKLKATGTANSATWIATSTTDYATPDLVTRCVVNCEGSTSGLVGLIGRYTNNLEHLFAAINASTGRLQLYSREAGVNTLLGQYTIISFSNTADYVVELRPSGDTLQVYLDGTLRITETFPIHNTATGFGVKIPDTVMSVDNYEIINVIADAGFNSSAYGGQQKQLNGIATATIPPGGTLTSVLWTQTAGVAVNAFTATTLQTNINAPSRFNAHSITFDLVAGYDEVLSLPDSVTINVDPGPEANAGPDQEVWVGDVVTLDGSAALIPAGLTVTSYNWAQETGSFQGTITTPSAVTATFTATSVQTTIPIDVQMRSIVTTSPNGTSDKDLVKIWILPNPVAHAGGNQSNIPAGATVNFDGSSSTGPNTYTKTYLWTQDSGDAVTIINPTSATPSFVAPSETYAQDIVLSLVVTSNGKSSPPDLVTASILAADVSNQAPTAVSGNQTNIAANSTIQFDFSDSFDPDGTIATYNLTQTGGTAVAITGGNAISNPTAVAPSTGAPQTLTFNLTVTDDEGAVSPTINFSIGVLADPNAPTVLTFTGNNGDPIPAELSPLAGAGQINTNELMSLGANPGAGWLFRYTNDFATSATQAVDVNCRGDASGVTGLLIRWIDGFNYIKAAINANTGRLQLLKTEAGVETVVSQFTIPSFNAATIYEVMVDYTPTSITGFLDGSQVINVTNDFGGTSVIAGLVIGRNTHALDNYNPAATLAANVPPTAVITRDPTGNIVAGSTFLLNFSGSSDSDGTVATYTLAQTLGTNTGSDGTSASNTKTVVAPNEANGQTLRYRLIVTDNDGAPSEAVFIDIPVLSNVANAAPTAVMTVSPAGAIAPGGTFTLDFSGSNDSDGTVVSYTLAQTLGTNTGNDGTSAATSKVVTAPDEADPQTLRYRLIVTDNDGSPSAAVFKNIDVLGNTANQPPVANAGPRQDNVPAGSTVTLDFTGSTDPDGTIVSYTIAQTLGDNVGLDGTSNLSTRTFTAPSTGSNQTLRFRLIVTDNNGAPSLVASFVDINVLAEAGADVTPPVITLIGPAIYNHPIGKPYVSPKSFVTDSGTLGIVPTITGTIDHTVAGTYSEFHNAVDGAGNVAQQVVRTVIVGDPLPPKPISSGTGSSSKSADEGMLDDLTPEISLDHVEFELIRITWDLVNPAEDAYDFSLVQKLINRAKSYGKFVNLMIVDSFHAPQWVKDNSSTFDYPFQFTQDDPPVPIIRTAPLAWDSSYLQAKQKLLNALGAAYDSEDAVRTVYFTYATMTNGAEFHWRVDESLYTAAGYNPTFQLNTAKLNFDYHVDAFARTNIAIESHTVFGSIDLNRGLVEYARTEIGARAGIAIWWGASRIATNDSGNDAEYASWLLTEEHKAAGGYVIIQCIGNFTDQAWRFNYENHPVLGITDWTAEEAFTYERNFFDGNSVYNLTSTAVDAYEYWPKDTKNVNLMPALLPVDSALPVITMLGSSSLNHPVNTPYVDAGATAKDSLGNDITSSIVTVNGVNDNTIGAYIVTYNVTDSDGIAAKQVVRAVNVVTNVAIPVVTISGVNTSEHRGAVSLISTTIGGTGSYSYTWRVISGSATLSATNTKNVILTGPSRNLKENTVVGLIVNDGIASSVEVTHSVLFKDRLEEQSLRIRKILDKCRITLSDKERDRYKDEDLICKLNEAQEDFCKETKVLKGSYQTSVSIGNEIVTMPEDCWMPTRATYKNQKLPLLTYADIDFLVSKSGEPNDFDITAGWEYDTGSPKALIYDKNDIGFLRIYPIPDETILDSDFTVDPASIKSSLKYFGSGVSIPGSGSEELNQSQLIRIYYVRLPAEVEVETDLLSINKMFDVALKYYVTGQSFLDDLDAGWQEKGIQQLKFYEREVERAKKSESTNHNRSGEFKTNYRSGF